MFKSMIPLAGVQVSVIWLLHHAYSHAPKLASNSAALGDKLALLEQKPKPTDLDIDDAMSGNICRCGTYLRIRAAIQEAARIKEA
jgi:isoquinoline 1-oxidoreductase alpha subunit